LKERIIRNMKKQNLVLSILLIMVIGVGMIPQVYAQGAADGPCAGSDNLGICIVSIYRWALGLGVLLALTMIIFSGYYYMTAGGDAQKVQSAKDIFANAFIGLIILFSAVLILRTINPDLVKFKKNLDPKAAFIEQESPDVAGTFYTPRLPRGE